MLDMKTCGYLAADYKGQVDTEAKTAFEESQRICGAQVDCILCCAAVSCNFVRRQVTLTALHHSLIWLAQDPDSKNHKLTQHACDVLQETHEQHACPCRNILAVVGPPGSGKSALVAAMCGRLYKPAKATGKIMISGREAYESFKPTWFSANDVLTSHLTVHQYLLYKGVCVCVLISAQFGRAPKGHSTSLLWSL